MPSNIYALLIGIDEYPDNITNLQGCVNDGSNVEAFLESRYADRNLSIRRLVNGEATRENIISEFRNHLTKQAKPGDVVLIHYSGHGARSAAAPEFKPFFPDGMDEGLVCVDSRLPGNFDLADKELAVLLSEVDQGCHIVCLFDCCHSGSATRSAVDNLLPQVRSARGNATRRSLESYIGGYYQSQYTQIGHFEIPDAKHILISACNRKQKAWETQDRQGLFTRSMIDVLEKLGDDVSYADLFARCRNSVRDNASNQDPQLATYSHFDAGSRFLGGTLTRKSPRFSLSFSNSWKTNCGAIHGVPVNSNQPVEFAVFDRGQPNEIACHAVAKSVGFQECEIELLDDEILEKATIYQCALTSPPAMPLLVWLDGEQRLVETWKSMVKEDASVGVDVVEDPQAAQYKIVLDHDSFLIAKSQTGQEVHTHDPGMEHSESEFKSVLKRLSNWHRTSKLHNNTTQFDTNLLDFELQEQLAEGEHFSYFGESNVMDVFEGRGDTRDNKINCQLKVKNCTGQELHIALVHLSSDYGIQSIYNEPISSSDDWVLMSPGAYFLDDQEPSGTMERYKLIASTDKIDGFLLQQDPIPPRSRLHQHRAVDHSNKVDLSHDWFTKDVVIQLVRRQDRIGDSQVSMCDGKIKIAGNARIRARAAVVPTVASTRSLEGGDEPMLDLNRHLLRNGNGGADDFSLVNLQSQNGQAIDAFEVSDIENLGELENNPLKFECDFQLAEDENVIPVFFDGEHVILAGETFRDDAGLTRFEIDHVPELASSVNRRSLGRSFKLYFLKAHLRRNVNRLRSVEFKSDGAYERSDDGIADKVAAADNILLLMHGIIGDTKAIADGLPLTLAGSQQKIIDQFDLVLAYDYENLNTPLQDTAVELARDLEKVGIGPERRKSITILAHSMGGLVAREFIENGWGKDVVVHLIMCGTPNDGSPFGKIDGARKIFQMLLTLSLNFDPSSVPFVGTLHSLLARSKRLTLCLEQMASNSEFINGLGTSVPTGVRYTSIAGDIGIYEEQSDSRIQALIAKVGKTGYWKEILFDGQSHDLAVSTNSVGAPMIKKDLQSVTVPCHHLNYFSTQAGLGAIAASLTFESKTSSN